MQQHPGLTARSEILITHIGVLWSRESCKGRNNMQNNISYNLQFRRSKSCDWQEAHLQFMRKSSRHSQTYKWTSIISQKDTAVVVVWICIMLNGRNKVQKDGWTVLHWLRKFWRGVRQIFLLLSDDIDPNTGLHFIAKAKSLVWPSKWGAKVKCSLVGSGEKKRQI